MIRKLGPQDLPSLHEVLASLPESFWRSHRRWNSEEIASEVSNELVWGLWEQNQLVAVIFYREQPEAFEIDLLATHGSFHRKGKMLELLDYFEERRGAKEIWLEVHEANEAAVGLYEKRGYERGARRPSYYPDGGAAVLYKLS